MCSSNIASVMPMLTGGISGAGNSILSQTQAATTQYQNQAQQYQQEMLSYQQQLAQIEINKIQNDNEARVRASEAVLKFQQIQLAEQEANASAAQDKTDAAREIRKAQSLAKLSALEGNADGVSAQRMSVDLGYTLGQKFAAIETSRESAIDQLQSEKIAAKLSAYTQPYYYTSPNEPTMPTLGSVNYGAALLSGLNGAMGNSASFLSGLGSSSNSQTSSYSTANPSSTSSYATSRSSTSSYSTSRSSTSSYSTGSRFQ